MRLSRFAVSRAIGQRFFSAAEVRAGGLKYDSGDRSRRYAKTGKQDRKTDI